MVKIILFVLLIGYLIFRFGKKPREQGLEAPPSLPEAMVRCAHCGIYVPQSEAVVDLGTQRAYCSAAHRVLGEK